jgi:ubiquinone/menaquinone biosynthesis C-methylase UbiE
MVTPVELLYSIGMKGMIQGETSLMRHEELNGTTYDDILFQRVIVEEMGELLPAKLLAECDLSHAESVLEIGSGAGEWLRAVAHLSPNLHCIGIDQDAGLVKAANVLAQRDHLTQVAFLEQELDVKLPTLLPQGSFDLVHLSMLSRYILTANYPALAQAYVALCRPGGMVCWTEAELPITNSTACERLISLICEAVQRTGQSFISEHMWQIEALFASRSGMVVSGHSTYTRRHLGITMMLRSWLRDAGCGALLETHQHTLRGRDTHEIHQEAYVIEVSAGQPAYEAFVRQTLRYSQRVKPLLLRTEVIEETEYSALCDQLEEELTLQDFCGLFQLLRAWAPRL